MGMLNLFGREQSYSLSSLEMSSPLCGVMLVSNANGGDDVTADIEAVKQLVLDAKQASVWVLMVVVISGDHCVSYEVCTNQILQ